MTISITSPTSGATVSGTINVTGVSTAPTVTVSDGGTSLGTDALSGQNYTVSVNTTSLTNGTQTLSVTDGLSTATVSVNVQNLTTGFAITSPVTGSSEATTFTMSGTSGTEWVNVGVYDSNNNLVGANVTPSGGTWSTTINMGTEIGSQTLTATASSLPAGQTGGNTATATATYTISSASPSGSTLNSTTGSLVDSSGNVWTLVNGGGSNGLEVYENGAAAGFTQEVILLLYYNGVIWQENVNDLWWPWNGTTWTGSGVSDPRPPAPTLTVTTPANNASVTAGSVTFSGTSNQSSVSINNGSTVLGTATPSGGNWSTSITMAAGSYNLTVSAGTATPVSLALTVTAVTPTLTVTSPANNATVSSPFTITGATNQSSVVVKNGSTTLATITPSGGNYSGSVTLAAGTYSLTVSAGTATPVTLGVTIQATTNANIHFYGVNGHYNQGGVYATNIAQQVTDMQYMGIKTMRQDCYDTSDTAAIESVLSSFAPIVIQPIWCDPIEQSSPPPEATAYSNSYAWGVTVAQQLAGKVPIIEMMNEPENFYFYPPQAPNNNGQLITDWSVFTSQWAPLRGAIRGFYAGFRSVDTTMQTLIASPSVGWGHYGILDGLWNGTAPDGSSGHPTATWDITNYHWYLDMGNIETALSPVNVLAYLKSAYGKPIILTEIGVQTSVSSSTYDNWITTGGLGLYQSVASTYNIINTCWYQLYTDGASPDMGLYTTTGTQNASRASTMKSFIAGHPMP